MARIPDDLQLDRLIREALKGSIGILRVDVDQNPGSSLVHVIVEYIDFQGAVDLGRKPVVVNFAVQAQRAAEQMRLLSQALAYPYPQTRPRDLWTTPPGSQPGTVRGRPMLEDLGTIKTEPYVGYRDFCVVGPLDICHLESRNSEPWPEREPLVARCHVANNSNRDWLTRHDAPNELCECGIYAFNSPDHSDLDDTADAWGEVNLWGDILIAPMGYRAEFAYPKTIFLRNTGTKMVRLARDKLEEEYGVPVFLVEKRDRTPLGEQLQRWINAEIFGISPDEADRVTESKAIYEERMLNDAIESLKPIKDPFKDYPW